MISSLKNLFSLGRNPAQFGGSTDDAEVDLEIDASLLAKPAKAADLMSVAATEATAPPEAKAAAPEIASKLAEQAQADDRPAPKKRQSKAVSRKPAAKAASDCAASSKPAKRKGLGSLGFGIQKSDWILPGSPGAPKIKMCSELDEVWDRPMNQQPRTEAVAA